MAERVYLTVQSDYRKVQVPVDDILYITIENRKTKITRLDGSTVCTNRSLKDIYAELPEAQFSSINRGIVVAVRQIRQEVGGVVTMADGTSFRRRVRSDRLPQREKVRAQALEDRVLCPSDLMEQWVGKMPLPMCVLEMVYRSRGRGVEFQLRYCNKALEVLEQVQLSEVRDRSIEELKGVGNAKWLTVFADVAVNGSSRTLEDVWPDGRFLRIHCYQPQQGFCALVLTDLTRENNLVQELFQRGR